MPKLRIITDFVGGVSGSRLGLTELYFEVSAIKEHNNGSSSHVLRSLYGIIPLLGKSQGYLITANNTPETICLLSKNPLNFIKRRIRRDIKKLTSKFPRYEVNLENNLLGMGWRDVVAEGTIPRYDAHSIRDYIESFSPLFRVA